jgi:hypothetical protein
MLHLALRYTPVQSLVIKDNPVSAEPQCYEALASLIPSLDTIDGNGLQRSSLGEVLYQDERLNGIRKLCVNQDAERREFLAEMRSIYQV